MQKNDYNIMLIIWLSKYDLEKELVISCRPVQDIHSTSGTMHSHDILTQFIYHIHSGNHMFLYDNDKTRTESTYLCRTICYGILKLMYPRAEIRQKQNKFWK